jgi:A/G-specific adenine glycosylase
MQLLRSGSSYLFDDLMEVGSVVDVWARLLIVCWAGLLGGLDEFPTEAVDEDEEDVSEADGALTSIQKLLLDTIAPMPPARLSSRHVANADEVKLLRMTRIEEAKDVLHIFSHIRKTYRVRWVLLEGGGDAPPQLRSRPTAAVKGGSAGKTGKSTKKPAKKAKSSADAIDVDAVDEKTDVPPTAAATKGIRWVAMNEVSDAK